MSTNWKELRRRESRMRGPLVWFNAELEAAGESQSVWEQPHLSARV